MSDNVLSLILDVRRAGGRGPEAIAERQRAHFAEMVSLARASSPYYRDLYQGLPERVEDPMLLPVTSKKELMARFDDWVTDRDVTLEKVRAFVADAELVGKKFLARYTVLTTSGTTGTPGIFVLDDRNMAVTTAIAVRMLRTWLRGRDVIRMIARGGRMAMVNATGGHFATAVAAVRLRERRGAKVQVFPVDTPLPEMVARLDEFRPTFLAPYASIGALLATEQQSGRLHIDPVLVVLSAEGLPLGEYDRIAEAFGAIVRHSYAATECTFLSFSCEHKWLHVNSDWVVLEPVEADYRPTPPGQQSHTALLSNLANRIQPILRYDIGDSVLQRPDPCPCGSPLPAIRVQGRSADVLTFPTDRGGQVVIAPLVFTTLGDHVLGVEQVQIVQTAPTRLRVRVRLRDDADRAKVWPSIMADIKRILVERNLSNVMLERAEEPPEQSAGGKYRAVIPLRG